MLRWNGSGVHKHRCDHRYYNPKTKDSQGKHAESKEFNTLKEAIHLVRELGHSRCSLAFRLRVDHLRHKKRRGRRLDVNMRCVMCDRILKSPISIDLGIGPTCRKRQGIDRQLTIYDLLGEFDDDKEKAKAFAASQKRKTHLPRSSRN